MTSAGDTLYILFGAEPQERPPDEPPFPNAIDAEVVPTLPLLTGGAAKDPQEGR